MSPVVHTHPSSSATNNSSTSKTPLRWSSLTASIGGVDIETATQLAAVNGGLTDYASSLQAYHLQNFQDTGHHVQKQLKNSPNKRPKKKQRLQSRKASQKHQYKETKQIHLPANPLKPASSFHSTLLERTYLLSSLQREDERATELLKQIELIQQYLELPFNNKEWHSDTDTNETKPLSNSTPGILTKPLPGINKRKLVRQLRHLKNRLSEITRQEMCMLARLEQITPVTNNRDEGLVQEEEVWGFPDKVDLHGFGWGFGGIQEGGNTLDTTIMKFHGNGIDTPGDISPGTRTPMDNPFEAVKVKVLDPRSPSFVPGIPLRRHSVIDWAEPKYKQIMDEVEVVTKQHEQEKNLEESSETPIFSLPSHRHSSLIDWSSPQYQHILNEVHEITQAQTAQIIKIQNSPLPKKIEIRKAPKYRSMQATIINLDDQAISPLVLEGRSIISRQNSISLLSPTHENYLKGLEKIRAASLAPGQTFLGYNSDSDSDGEEEEGGERRSWSVGMPAMGESLRDVEVGVGVLIRDNGERRVGYNVEIGGQWGGEERCGEIVDGENEGEDEEDVRN